MAHAGGSYQRWLPRVLFVLLCALAASVAVVQLQRERLGWTLLAVSDAASEQGGGLAVFVAAQRGVSEELDAGVRHVRGGAAPLAGAKASAFRRRADGRYQRLASGDTDASGRVLLGGVSGAIWVSAEAPGWARSSRALDVAAAGSVHFQLVPAVPAKLRVVDEQGEPVLGATVLLDDGDPLPFGGLTDAEGHVVFTRARGGARSVSVFARGYEALRERTYEDGLELVLAQETRSRVHLVDSAGASLAGAELLIAGPLLSPARRAMANERGIVELRGLEPGAYEVRAFADDRLSPLTSLQIERGASRTLELTLEPARRVSVVVLELGPEGERPIPGAEVVLSDEGIAVFPFLGRTDARGRVVLGPVPLTSGVVSVSADGFFGPGMLRVPPAPAREVRVVMERGAWLRGDVVDSDGRPVAGARIEVVGVDRHGYPILESPLRSAYRKAHFDASLASQQVVASGELGVTLGPVPFVNQALTFDVLPDDYKPWLTSLNGYFRVGPVPAGRLRALVRHPAYVEGMSAPVQVAPGASGTVQVVLHEGGRLRGTVVDEYERPVPGARVRVMADSGGYEHSVITGAEGRFALNAVPERVVALVAAPDDITHYRLREVLTLTPGAELSVELHLPPERRAVRFRVVDDRDVPVELAQVELRSTDPGTPLRVTRFTDRSGFAEFSDAAGLAVSVDVSAPGFAPVRVQYASLPEETGAALDPGVTVRGRIAAVRGRVAVSGAAISLTTAHGTLLTHSDASGDFAFNAAPAGTATVRVRHGQYASARRVVSIEGARDRRRELDLPEIVLEERTQLTGLVVSAAGEPVAHARVGVEPQLPSQPGLDHDGVSSDDAGRFTIEDAPAGTVTLYAYHSVYGSGQVQADAAGSDEARIVLQSGEELQPGQGGLAIALEWRDTSTVDQLVISRVQPGSSAEDDGLRAGDVVLALDGEVPRTVAAAQTLLRGRAGSDVVVEVERGGQIERFRVRRESVQ